jgi:heat shock protein HslJ
MRIGRSGAGLILALLYFCFTTTAQETMTVTGTLRRVMAIGGETTGWAIQLDAEISIGDKPFHSIEVESHAVKKLDALENRRVQASGKLLRRQGVETGSRMILSVSSINEVKASPPPATAFHLANSAWALKDLGGAETLAHVPATLVFQEAGKVSGNASCNRFFGQAKIEESSIKLGPLGATRMACSEAIMNQEARYLNALQAAERFEWKDPYLLLKSKGVEQPLRFTRMTNTPH